MARESTGKIYPVSSAGQTLTNVLEPPAAHWSKTARGGEQKKDDVERHDFCLYSLSAQLIQYQNTRTQTHGTAFTAASCSEMEALLCTSITQRWKVWMKPKLENDSRVDLEFQAGGRNAGWGCRLNRQWYGQGSEGTGEGTKMHLFPLTICYVLSF